MNSKSVIEQIKSCRKGENRPWIFDENGNIKDDVICCDAVDVINILADYEVNKTEDELYTMFDSDTEKGWFNTYNDNANISNDIDYKTYIINDNYYVLAKFHLFGDVRGNYSDYILWKFDNEDSFIYTLLDDCNGEFSKVVKDNGVEYWISMIPLCEIYDVYNSTNEIDYSEHYEIEVSELLESLKNESLMGGKLCEK